MIKQALLVTATLAGLTTLSSPMVAQADMFASPKNWSCLANAGGRAVLQTCSASRNDNQINYIANGNLFYGTLKQGGQCLDIKSGVVMFTGCNGTQSQIWKFDGNGQLNNQGGYCVVPSGMSVVVAKCPANYTWSNATYKAIVIANLSVPKGTPLAIRGKDLINSNTGQVVAAGAGPAVASAMAASSSSGIVASGGGNIVASGGGNIVASGGGNIVVGANASAIVASGGGN